MKNLIALFVVALLATSVTFANGDKSDEASVNINVTVNYPAIQITAPTVDFDIVLQPDMFKTAGNYTFSFTAMHAYGVLPSSVTEVWSSTSTYVRACNKMGGGAFSNPDPIAGALNSEGSNMSTWTVPQFGVYCFAGAPAEEYTITYTLTLDY